MLGRLLVLQRIGIKRDETFFEGQQYQVGIAVQVECFHDVMLVKLDRLLTQVQMSGDFLDLTPFSAHLHNVTLSWSQMLGVLARPGLLYSPVFGSELRSYIAFTMHHLVDCLQQL